VVLTNGFAQTEVTQTFHNPNDVAVEALYAFPLPKSASLSELTITAGERELHGEVVEAQQARQVYREEQAQGRDAGQPMFPQTAPSLPAPSAPRRSLGEGAARGRPPRAALGLAALAVAIYAVPGATAGLEYDRAAIAGGQLWRLLTGHWTHWAVDHLLWDVVAFAALGLACEYRSPGRCWATPGVAGLAISLAIWVVEPGLPLRRFSRG
jgi:hypothetical protein